jgi:hypothetical protein
MALLSVHLATNYAAVTAVSMRSLNRQRANIVLGRMLQTGRVLEPKDVSRRERVFERDGVLRWTDDHIIGHCSIGVPLERLLGAIGQRQRRTGSLQLRDISVSELLHLYEDQAYVLWFAQSEATIVLKQGCTPTDQLKAWCHALLLAQSERHRATESKWEADESAMVTGITEIKSTMKEASKRFDACTEDLRRAGWNLDIAALETRAGTRVSISTKNAST